MKNTNIEQIHKSFFNAKLHTLEDVISRISSAIFIESKVDIDNKKKSAKDIVRENILYVFWTDNSYLCHEYFKMQRTSLKTVESYFMRAIRIRRAK